jgi:hypothetical protein
VPDIVAELPEPTIAIEAEYPANPSRFVIVIDVLGFPRGAKGAYPALPPNELVDLVGANPLASTKVVVARAAVALPDEVPVARVMAKLAIAVVTGTASFVAGKLGDRLGPPTSCACEL